MSKFTDTDKRFEKEFDCSFCCGGDYCEGGHDEETRKDFKSFLHQELDRAYNEGLGRGYRDSLKDCIDLTDCEECKEHLKVLKTK